MACEGLDVRGVEGCKTAIEERLQQTFCHVVEMAPHKPSRFARIVTTVASTLPIAAISKLIPNKTCESPHFMHVNAVIRDLMKL